MAFFGSFAAYQDHRPPLHVVEAHPAHALSLVVAQPAWSPVARLPTRASLAHSDQLTVSMSGTGAADHDMRRPDERAYFNRHIATIEAAMAEALNTVLSTMPEDPVAGIAAHLATHCRSIDTLPKQGDEREQLAVRAAVTDLTPCAAAAWHEPGNVEVLRARG